MSKKLSRVKFKNNQNPTLLEIFNKRTILTEKTFKLEMEQNCLTFSAPDWVNKTVVRACFEKIFGCEILSLNVLNVKGDKKRFRGYKYETSSYKKFYIRVSDPSKVAEVLK